jgi:C-terminal processing protease CtpA/Prc
VSVSSVLPQSPFSMAGVEVGDVFLDIDGTDVSNVSHGDAVRLLKAAPKRFVIKLYSRRRDRGTAPTQVRPPPPRFNGELEAKAREYTIARTSDKEPLGVALFSDSLDRWVQVHMAVPGGPFDRAGVGANDVILEVNGRSMLGLSHPEVVVELKRGPKDIKVKTASINDVLGTQLPEAPQNESDMMQSTTFVIRRIENKGLGIAICSDKGKTGIRIRNVTPDGPFGAAGVPRGSVIVRLDGAVMLDATHADVVEALRNAGDEFEVTVATDREVADYTARRADGEAAKISLSPYSSPTPLKPTKFEITRKPNQGLGVALCSNKRRLGVRISQLDPKGPLALAGVKELDVIVQVHGFPCLKASHDEVVQAFRRAPDDFTVVVVSGDHFDDVTPEYARSPTSAGSAQDALDEMRANILHSRTSRNRSTGSRGEIFVEQSSTGADEMRSDQHAFRDSRIADALENTEGCVHCMRVACYMRHTWACPR